MVRRKNKKINQPQHQKQTHHNHTQIQTKKENKTNQMWKNPLTPHHTHIIASFTVFPLKACLLKPVLRKTVLLSSCLPCTYNLPKQLSGVQSSATPHLKYMEQKWYLQPLQPAGPTSSCTILHSSQVLELCKVGVVLVPSSYWINHPGTLLVTCFLAVLRLFSHKVVIHILAIQSFKI